MPEQTPGSGRTRTPLPWTQPWATGRGVEPMAPSYGILDMTVHGRQETWEDSPPGWPQPYESSARSAVDCV
ncbi:DUF899 family protein [Streptomyces sp. SID2888]|uniref:DUF899 family protein n=1 Tax=Streptomyces sp. SID2888 TaxID=2690256 RepID=UPI002351A04C|nr:DUF899 family protein [Streptomyces sp. SID2888]